MKKLNKNTLHLGIVIGTSIGGGFSIFALGFYIFLNKEGYILEQADIRIILTSLLIASIGWICAAISWAILSLRDLKRTINSHGN